MTTSTENSDQPSKSWRRFKYISIISIVLLALGGLHYLWGENFPNHGRAKKELAKFVEANVPTEHYVVHNADCRKGDSDGNGKESCYYTIIHKENVCDLKTFELECTSAWWWQDWVSDGCSGGSAKNG